MRAYLYHTYQRISLSYMVSVLPVITKMAKIFVMMIDGWVLHLQFYGRRQRMQILNSTERHVLPQNFRPTVLHCLSYICNTFYTRAWAPS